MTRTNVQHDAKPGPLQRCQICGSNHLRLIIDLGHQPPCDALLTVAQLHQPEVTYPLRLMQCEECSLAQLDYVVPAATVYPASYPYKAGISWPVVAAHKAMAAALVERFGPGLVVDVGCNDGTLLAQFKALGCPVFGVEPTDIAKVAMGNGIPTHHAFFSEYLARYHFERDKAHLMTFTNVFAHMGDLGEVMRGICVLLAKDGVLVVENHYLMDVLALNQFDTIYHEHVRTYTLKSLVTLFAQYGLEVFDVERVPRYGGNIRVYVGWTGGRPIGERVADLLSLEGDVGLNTAERWAKFRDGVYRARDDLVQCLTVARGDGGTVVGCSAPGRASTLLNFCGIGPDLLPWTGELEGSLKIGKYLPSSHIPVVSNKRIVEEQPDALILLSWHYATEIAARLRNEGVRSKLIVPLPEFGVA